MIWPRKGCLRAVMAHKLWLVESVRSEKQSNLRPSFWVVVVGSSVVVVTVVIVVGGWVVPLNI